MAFSKQFKRGISKYARITIIHVCFIAFTFAGSLGRCLNSRPSGLGTLINIGLYGEKSNSADQRRCFHYIDNTIPLLCKSEISSLCGCAAQFVLYLVGNS